MLVAIGTAIGQDPANTLAPPEPSERWNLYFQATSIGDYHPSFPALYSGDHSLQNYMERDVSLTSTLYLGIRLAANTQVYIDPEIAGGRGFSGVNGVANAPNGELPRVASATPKPYVARAYINQDFGFGSAREVFDSGENQLAGSRPMNRYSITAGRFTVTDFFDNNRYSHDPRTQFMGWAVMYNGAWDYPAERSPATPTLGCTNFTRAAGAFATPPPRNLGSPMGCASTDVYSSIMGTWPKAKCTLSGR